MAYGEGVTKRQRIQNERETQGAKARDRGRGKKLLFTL